jgi:hypothetical protein
MADREDVVSVESIVFGFISSTSLENLHTLSAIGKKIDNPWQRTGIQLVYIVSLTGSCLHS